MTMGWELILGMASSTGQRFIRRRNVNLNSELILGRVRNEDAPEKALAHESENKKDCTDLDHGTAPPWAR